MTDADHEILARWLLHGPGALWSADDLRALFADKDKLRELVRELCANKFGAARPHYSPHS